MMREPNWDEVFGGASKGLGAPKLGLSSSDPAARQAPADVTEAPAEKPRYAPAPTTEEGAQARLAEVQSAESEIRAWAESKRLKKSGGRPSAAAAPQQQAAAPAKEPDWDAIYGPAKVEKVEPEKPGLMSRVGSAIKDAGRSLADAATAPFVPPDAIPRREYDATISKDPLSKPLPLELSGLQYQPGSPSALEGLRQSRRDAEEVKASSEPSAMARSLNATVRKPLDNSLVGAIVETAGDAARGAVNAAPGLATAAWGIVQAGADIAGAQNVAGVAKHAAAAGKESTQGRMNPNGDHLVSGAIQSLTSSLIGGMAFGVPGAIATAVGQTSGEKYSELRKGGIGVADSAEGAIVHGIAEFVGERIGMPSLGRFVLGIAGKTGAKPTAVLGEALKQQGEEQVTLALQSLYDKVGRGSLRRDMTLDDYLKDVVETVQQTAIMTAASAGGGAILRGAGKAADAATAIGARPADTKPADAISAGQDAQPRPTEQKAAIHSRLDDFAVQTGMPENAVSAIKKASDGVPLSELPGRIKRAIVALRQRGLFKGPVDEQTLSVLDEPPIDVSNPAAEMNTSAGRVDASNTPENPAGISGSPADEDYTGLAGPKESDLTTIDGHPYGTKSGATARANKVGGEVVEVPGGFVVRPKEQDGPDAAGDGGSQPADAGRGAGAELVPDQRPADVLAGPAEPARQGVDVAGADGNGRDGRADALKPGVVGGKMAGGEVVLTATGRPTTPFPPVKLESDRKAANTVKAVDKWLMQNALNEARARGDEFAARQFEQAGDKPQQADKDSAEEYLFGGQVAPVPPPMLKPLRPNAEATVEPSRRVIGKYGRTPNAATEVELRPNADGTLTPFDGKHAMVDFESGNPIVMPAEVTDAQAADAIRNAGAITAKDKFFGVKPDAKPAQQDRPASGPVQPAADSQARADLDAALGDLGSILGASNAETSPPAEGTGASHEGQGQGEGRRRETRLLNDQAQAPSTAPAPSRQSTHVRPLDDARLTDPTWRAELEASKADIGWQGRGGRLVRDPRTAIDLNSPDAHREGDVVGRTQWLGSDIWRTRPTEGGRINETQAREAIDKALAGEPLTTAQRRYVAHVLDFTQGQLDERERKVYEALEDAMIEAQDRADEDAIELFWASLARLEAQEETYAKQDAAEVDAEDARRDRGAEETSARVTPQGDGRVSQEVRAAQADEGLTLEAQTEQDLRDKAAREEAAAQAERNRQAELAARDAKAKRERDKAEKDARAAQVIAEREAEKKREIDAAAESFELGQEPPKPVDRKVSTEQARGQRDVFDAPSEPAKPAPTPLTDEQAYADNFARFEGKTLAMTFTVADTGQTATLKPDAAKTMRAQQARLDALKALRTCLGA